jgi:hypothetical protein
MRRGLAGGIGVLIAFTAAPVASGGITEEGGFSYASKFYKLVPGQTKSLRSKCPGGTHVLGGGSISNASTGEVFQSGSYPYDGGDRNAKPDDGWTARLSSFDRTVEASIHAICAPIGPRYETRTRKVSGEALSEWNVGCGTRNIVHGGYRGPAGTLPRSSYPSDAGDDGDSWALQIWNETDKQIRVKGYAVCSNALDVSYATSQKTFSAGGESGPNPACPVDAPHVVGGGFVNFASQLGSFRVVDDGPFLATPDLWGVGAEVEGSAVDVQIWSDCAPDR